MRTFGRVFGVLSLIALAAVMPACNSSSSSGGGKGGAKPYVAFVSNNAEEFWTYARRGTEAAAKEFNVEVEFRSPSTGDVATQHEIIEDLQSKGVQAIAVSPNDSANQVGYYKQLNKKLPVVAVDNDLPDADARRCYLGTDNVTAGKAVGKLVRQAMPDGGKFMIFVGKLDSQNAQERRRGVVTELAGGEDKCKAELDQMAAGKYPVKFGKYELVDTRTDEVSQATCQAKCEDALSKVPDLACIVGLWAYNPPAMLRAVHSQKKVGKVIVIGFDENDETLAGIRSGEIAGTVVQNPYDFGYESVRIMAGIVRGEANAIESGKYKPSPGPMKQIYVRHRIINKDGKPQSEYKDELVEAVDPFQTNLKKQLGK
jgi:ribose transport system substrate-binding protein